MEDERDMYQVRFGYSADQVRETGSRYDSVFVEYAIEA
jgi:hypothetical protein